MSKQSKSFSPTKIQAVVFDFGGVVAYIDDYTQAVTYLMDTLALSKEELRHIVKKMCIFTRDGGSERVFWENYCVSHGKRSINSWWNSYIEMGKEVVVKIQGTEVIVKKLKEKGYQTAMLSNIIDTQAQIVRDLGYYSLFHPVLLSCETGCNKPNQEAFTLLLHRLHLPACAVLFVDDKEPNVEAAKKEGIDSILFTSPEQLQKELENRGVL